MGGRNGLPSSEDELFPSAFGEPIRYEFQSYLSDDNNDDENNQGPEAAPEPVASDDDSDFTPKRMASDSPPSEDEALESSQNYDDYTNGTTNGVETDSESEYDDGANLVDIEVRLDWMSPEERASYEPIEVDEEEEPIPGVVRYSPRRLRKRTKASYDESHLARVKDLDEMDTRKRKRKENDTDFDGGYDDEDVAEEYFSGGEDGEYGPRPRSSRQKNNIGSYFRSIRTSRTSSRFPSTEADVRSNGSGRGRRSLRPRSLKSRISLTRYSGREERDELQDSDDEQDPDFAMIRSDIVQTKGRKKLRKLPAQGRRVAGLNGHSDIEFEKRRSSRANKYSNLMTDSYVDDDEIYYVDEEKAVPGRKLVASMREVFPPTAPAEFLAAHRDTCDTCLTGESPNRGSLVYCQGCSTVQHKGCLGTRSTREQRVTKVGQDFFVLQCRFCLCVHRRRDHRAPHQDTCQACRLKGPSCAAFSFQKTPKQEEVLRNENDGVDPVTPVAPQLINNADNVLFRCTKCHRGWHYEHLPHPHGGPDPALTDPLNLRKHRLIEYQITWLCKECQEFDEYKLDTLVAWRPNVPGWYKKGQSILDFNEDQIQYLVKWQGKSHNHCAWLPGGWVHGVAAAAMRKAFYRRTLGETNDYANYEDLEDDFSKDSLMKLTEKDAVHESWITPDIILEVIYAPRTKDAEQKYKRMTRDEKYEHDLNRVLHVTNIYVKFEGLSYDDAVWDTPPDPSSGRLWDAFLDAYHEYLNGKHFETDSWPNMKERIDEFRKLDFNLEIAVNEQPKGLQRGKLMAYQLEGLNWMLYKFRHKQNVILADEMGLGKTVQVVALLTSLVQDNPKIWPFLIVVPNATCANWRREIKKWAPGLRVVAYYGGRAPQSLVLQYELFPNGSLDIKAHVVIMSYDSIKDPETKTKFNSVKWAGLVVDEAQALKNDENTLYKVLKNLPVPFKLLLTGTPLQNNKRELFNLLQFIDPARNAIALDEEFKNITKENLPELHKIIRPYCLRRTKAEVLTFLPPMAQIILPVSMSVLQERLCKSIMERNPDLIRSIFAKGRLKTTERGSLNNILMQLRKCLCHPFVYSQAIEDRNVTEDMMFRNLVEASSKLVLLQVMLPKLQERGHRVLMFSQFLEELTILEDFLKGMGFRYERLDGNQSSLEKQKRIDAFNAPDSKIFVMLLSTRAGGVGINLATADTVIIMDPDWNPHQDIQALSRAHRIGQKKKVLCFQIMTVDSAEEKILQIGRKKMALDHLLIESMDDKEGEVTNDVESVLKHGAAALFGEGRKKDTITYDSAAVDKLLDRSAEEETKQDADKTAESAFALARVWAHDNGGELTEDMNTEEHTMSLNVWNQILQERAEAARKEAEKQKEILGRGGRRRNATNYTSQKSDFDEGQGGIDSEESADEDFVGGAPESDGESSDDDKYRASGADSKIIDSKQDSKVLDPNSDSKVVDAKSEPRVVEKANQSHKTRPQTAAHPTSTHTAAPLPNGNSIHKETPNLKQPVTNQPNGVGQHRGGGGHPNGGSLPARPAEQRVVPVAANVQRQRQPGQPSPSGTSPAAGAEVRGARPSTITPTQRAQVELMKQKFDDACLVCGFLHPVDWECPEMSIEIRLRLALDKLRTMPAKDPQDVALKKALLTQKLMQLRNKQATA